jgi:organic radical activating enzyme
MKRVVTIRCSNYCINRCPYCVTFSNHVAKEDDILLDFRATVDWLNLYRPGAEAHVMGGEPMVCKDIESKIQLLIDAEYPVTLYTNGQRISTCPKLLDMPMTWIVTFHQDARFPIDKFLEQIEPLRGRKNVVIHTIMHMEWHEEQIDFLTEKLSGFAFFPKWAGQFSRTWTDWGLPDPEPVIDAAERLLLIEPPGGVFPCNTQSRGPCGNVYEKTYYPELAQSMNEAASGCFAAKNCGAFLTATMMEHLCG